MGVSSISSVYQSFSQNVKSLQQYYALLDQQQLPIYRGYELNNDDLIRNEIIQQIACQFKLNFAHFEKHFKIDFKQYFKKEIKDLKEMHDDGLLTLDDQGLSVSAAGRILVRHICMVFDIYLRTQTQQRFSKVI
jgi:oxygen-independent coproporphyrinogen-3 oxidase